MAGSGGADGPPEEEGEEEGEEVVACWGGITCNRNTGDYMLQLVAALPVTETQVIICCN